MAKKKEALVSLFVPVEEQPYPIPENWCWTYIGHCYGVTSSKRIHKEDWKDSGVPFYRTRELVKLSENGYVDNELFIANDLYEKLVADYGKPKIGDVLISGVGTIGVPFIVKENTPFYFKDGNVIWFQCKGICSPEYIFYLYKSNFMNNLIHDMSAGTTVDTYTIINANRTVFPLPPLPEQHRIVSRIESIFAKLDEAKEKAQAVVDSFELRKSAILHKAFTGKLTERWRGKNDVSLTDWKQVKFGDLGVLERGRSKHRPRNDPKLFGGKYPFIQTGDVARSGMYVVEHSQTLSKIGMEQSRIFPKDTLCITIAANIGDVAILTYDCCFPDSVVGFTPNGLTSSKFIYYMMSTIQRELEANAPATAQKNINLKILSDLMINLPSISEQKEIITVLENIFEKQQQAREAAEAVLAQIDTMKKAILARAFRGKLGTNDPNEEWAGEMLKKSL